MKILIADDDSQILRALRVTLRARGYEIVTSTTGADAIDLAGREKADLYLIDLGLPQFDGIDVITALRGWTDAPILVISGRTDSGDKVQALDVGADDYVTKPFAVDELLARIRALTRRRVETGPSAPVVRFGAVVIDVLSKTVTRNSEDGTGHAIRLTPTEWQMLEILIKNEGRLVTRQTLLSEIWGTSHVTDTGYLRLYISQLRKKLEPDPAHPRFLLTEPGMGYRFSASRGAEASLSERAEGSGPMG